MLLQLLRQLGSEPKAQSPWSTGTFDGEHWLVCFKASDILCLIKPGMRCCGVGGGINTFYCSQKKHLQINLRAERGGFSPISFTIIIRYSGAPAKLIIHPMNIAGIDDQVLLFRVQSEHSLPPGRRKPVRLSTNYRAVEKPDLKLRVGTHELTHCFWFYLLLHCYCSGLKTMTPIYFLKTFFCY